MTKKTMSNAWVILFCLLFITIFISSPAIYMQSTIKGLSIWLNAIVPSLFPFFFASKLLTNYMPTSYKPSTNIFLISIISGYPVGAKLLSDKCKTGEISAEYCTRALALCSTSGPLFLLGSIGIGVFKSYKAGIILLVSHIVGSVINGLIYKKKEPTKIKNLPTAHLNLGDTMYDSVISLFLVGGFITISYIVVDMLSGIGVLGSISKMLAKLLHVNQGLLKGVLTGLIEMTRGCIDISLSGVTLPYALTLCSGLIGFAGVSVFLQTICFLPPQVKKKRVLLQKATQGILCMLVCIILCLFLY